MKDGVFAKKIDPALRAGVKSGFISAEDVKMLAAADWRFSDDEAFAQAVKKGLGLKELFRHYAKYNNDILKSAATLDLFMFLEEFLLELDSHAALKKDI